MKRQANEKGKRENERTQRDCFQFSQYIFASLIHPHFINCFVFSIYRIYLQFQMNANARERKRYTANGEGRAENSSDNKSWNKYSQTNKPIVCSQLWMCFVWHIRKLANGIPSKAPTKKYLCFVSSPLSIFNKDCKR